MKHERGSLLVISGPPGSGKSTVGALVGQHYPRSAVVVGDTFFNFLARDAVDPWLPEAVAQNAVVMDAAGAATGRLVDAGYTTVFEGVVGPKHLQAFLAAARLPSLHYALLLPDVERCVERVAVRTEHHFSDVAATRQVHAQLSRASLAPRHRFDQSDLSAEATAELVIARYEDQLLVFDPSSVGQASSTSESISSSK